VSTLGSSRLRRLAQSSTERVQATQEHCDLCGNVVAPEHRHLLELSTRELRCACRACAILFDSPAASEGRYRLVPARRLSLTELELSDLTWEGLRLPVDIAFLFRSSTDERVLAFYPSPMGATESLLDLEAWDDLEAANPVLRTLVPDVEALLVNRTKNHPGHWLVPIDDAFRLVGLIRTRWRGLTGGREVWQEIGVFFEDLDRRSRPASGEPSERTMAWPG
jgi:Family of unknown function (DUF5947)